MEVRSRITVLVSSRRLSRCMYRGSTAVPTLTGRARRRRTVTRNIINRSRVLFRPWSTATSADTEALQGHVETARPVFLDGCCAFFLYQSKSPRYCEPSYEN